MHMKSEWCVAVRIAKHLFFQIMAKKRKLSNFTTDDRSAMLLALQHFQDTLDPEDEELPTGIHDTLDQLRQKLELVKVRYNA